MNDPAVSAHASPSEAIVDQVAAFEDFFRVQTQSLYAHLCLITGNRAEAEEIAQDAFLKVWERWDRAADMEEPVGYLYRTAGEPQSLPVRSDNGAFRSGMPNVVDFAIGRGAVWIDTSNEVSGPAGPDHAPPPSLHAIDPTNGDVLTRSVGRGPMSASPGAPWATVDGGIDEIDPTTGRHLRHFGLPGGTELVATVSTVWVADEITNTLTRVDIGSGPTPG